MHTITDIIMNALDKDYSLEQAATNLGDLMNELELVKRRSGAAMGLPTSEAESAEEHGTVRWQVDRVVMGNAIRGVRVRQFICMPRNRPIQDASARPAEVSNAATPDNLILQLYH